MKPADQYPFYKNSAVALIFSVLLGPVGLLYASVWGGILLILLAIIFASCHFFFLFILLWLMSCIWSVRAVESYNRKIYAKKNS